MFKSLTDGLCFLNSTGVVATTNVVEACTDVDIAIMVGGFPRKDGMERKDVVSKNVSIYKAQASALEQHASSNCKVRFFDSKISVSSIQNASFLAFTA